MWRASDELFKYCIAPQEIARYLSATALSLLCAAMKRSNQMIGSIGEDHVVDHFTATGHEIIDRNWRVREGEIDIITCDRHRTFHFVEVKTRTSLAYGHPFEAISQQKAHRLQRLALAWLATHGELGAEYQIDVAAVLISSDGELVLEIRENVL